MGSPIGVLFDLDGTLLDSVTNTFWHGTKRCRRKVSSSPYGEFIGESG